MRELLLLAIILVCPLGMMLMMRGGHGQGGTRKGIGVAADVATAMPRASRSRARSFAASATTLTV